MRKYLMIFFLLCGLPQIVFSQWKPGKYMKQAVDRVVNYGILLEQNSKTLGLADGTCLLGAVLAGDGGYSDYTFHLKASRKYTFIGGGDDDVKDLDLKLMDSKGTIVASDTKDDRVPVVHFKPSVDGSYTIRLINHSEAVVFSALIVLHTGGYILKKDRMDQSISRLISLSDALNDNTTETLFFKDNAKEWCLFGYNLDKSSVKGIDNLSLTANKHYILATCQSADIDIDLCVMNANNTKELKCDKEDDGTPIVDYELNTAGKRGLKIVNNSKSERAYVLTSVLWVDEK